MSRSGRAIRRSRSATIAGVETARRSRRVCPGRLWRSAICVLVGSAIAVVPEVAAAQQLERAGAHAAVLAMVKRSKKKRVRDDATTEEREEGAKDGGSAPEEAQKAYAAGLEARDRGAYEEAAKQFYTAYELLPAEPRERRAAVLFDLVAARRSAYEEKGDTAQLCASSRALDGYIKADTASASGEIHRDTRKARELRAMVQADVELLQDMDPALDCDKLRVEGEPPPSETDGDDPASTTKRGAGLDGRRLVIAGAVTTGVGALLLGATVTGVVIYAGANADQQELINGGAPIPAFTLEEIGSREQLGAGLAIGGGVLAGAALGAGITMLVLGRRAGASSRMSFAPFLTPRARGVALGMRF